MTEYDVTTGQTSGQSGERNHAAEEATCERYIEALQTWLAKHSTDWERVGETANGGAIWGFAADDGTPLSLSLNVTP
jgi:hypothetical protein